MDKSVSTRQLLLILIVSMVTLKVLYLPSLLAKDMGRDAYLFVFFMLTLDFLVLAILLFLIKKFPDTTLKQMLQNIFGRFFYKVIFFLLFLFFLLKCWGIFEGTFSYLNENLYTSLKWTTFSIPILISVYFVVNTGKRPIARITEIFAPIIIFGLILSFLIGVFRADFSNILPFLDGGVSKIFSQTFRYSFWFGDYIVLLIFFGDVKIDKHFKAKTLLPIAFFIILITAFFVVSYCLFGYNSVCHTNSISDTLQVLPSTSDIGSLDWVLILIWDISLVLNLIINATAAVFCLKNTVKVFSQKTSSIIVVVSILVMSLIASFDVFSSIQFVRNIAGYFCFAVQYALPVLIFIFSFKNKNMNKNMEATTWKNFLKTKQLF